MEAFVWMFKKEDFKKHFGFICLTTILLYVVTIAVVYGMQKLSLINPLYTLIVSAISGIVIVLPIFFLLGYFWELTSNIINRDFDILSNQIYDGKVKKVYNIDFPEMNIFKLLWRGFASIIASILLVLPYGFLIYIAIKNGTMFNINGAILILLFLFFLLLPAVQWNYAKQNSIFAVLDIFKAVFIFGNYTYRYLKAVLLFVLVYIVNHFLDLFVFKLFNPTFDITNAINILVLFSCATFVILKLFYLIFVNAYILGTIVPTQEG